MECRLAVRGNLVTGHVTYDTCKLERMYTKAGCSIRGKFWESKE